MIQLNKIYNENCLDTMVKIPDNYIDLIITSPPYSNLREYQGYIFEFETISKELLRILKQGGVLVWIVGDKTSNGTEELLPFKQALYFKEIGFNVHDTMIYAKNGNSFPANNKYNQSFEFMFILSKGIPKTFNPIREPKTITELIKIGKNKQKHFFASVTQRQTDGTLEKLNESAQKRLAKTAQQTHKISGNIWYYNIGYMKSCKDTLAFNHPAIFPEQLVLDHLLSWSNSGKETIVYDPFGGSGTTGIIAYEHNRSFILSEISNEYCNLIKNRFKFRDNINIEII